ARCRAGRPEAGGRPAAGRVGASRSCSRADAADRAVHAVGARGRVARDRPDLAGEVRSLAVAGDGRGAGVAAGQPARPAAGALSGAARARGCWAERGCACPGGRSRGGAGEAALAL
ncbi:MAG: hypothetical protein AVDCRST_MAG85-1203, partial [uncultured Solirubrobacteraceae bacterium]